MSDHSTDEIRFERRGHAGVVILDRPKALNALTLPMVRAMSAQLDDWAADPRVAHVVLTSTSEKAFCAGGDIRRIHDMGRAKEPGLTDFFHDEYLLNTRIHRYAKPFTSLIDGICMGGGVGLSAHAPYRVGSEKTLFAMPEVGIGFFPDVGGTHMLGRFPGETGAYVAMTGGRLKRVAPYLDREEPFFLTYGDGVSDVDLTALAAFHRAHGKDATITAVAPPGRYGALEIDEGKVQRFVEKPPGDNGLINGGFFVLNPAVVDRIEGDATVWEQQPLEGLAADGQLMAYRHDGFWEPMDTQRDLDNLNQLWGAGRAPWNVWDE